MKRIILSLFLCAVVCTASAYAQSIRMTRVDAPPEKSHFITATLPFSMEIALTGVNNVTAVSFELRYNNAGSVQLSGYSGGSFGSAGLLVVDKSNKISGVGSINIGVLSGQPPDGGGVNDPIIVRLDFITTPDARHNTNTVFSFVNAEAVAGGSITRLSGAPVVYNVHGFMDVWPGDADNNGIVDTRDISVIGLFFDDGDASGRIRGFSRKPASTAWGPQTALAWDSVRVTYVDGDGSGKVDLNDLLVVYANFSKTHAKANKNTGDVMSVHKDVPEEEVRLSSTSVLIPVEVKTKETLLGVASTVSWSEYADKFHVVGMKRGEAFGDAEGFFSKIDPEKHKAYFAIGRFNPAPEMAVHGPVVYLVAEPLGSEQTMTPVLEQPRGIKRNGAIVDLSEVITGVDDIPASDALHVSLAPNPAPDKFVLSLQLERASSVVLSLVDALGNTVYTMPEQVYAAGTVSLPVDVSTLATGVYYCVLRTESATITRPITVVR